MNIYQLPCSDFYLMKNSLTRDSSDTDATQSHNIINEWNIKYFLLIKNRRTIALSNESKTSQNLELRKMWVRPTIVEETHYEIDEIR